MASAPTEEQHSAVILRNIAVLPKAHREKLLRSIQSILEAFDRNEESKVQVPVFESMAKESVYFLTEFHETAARFRRSRVKDWKCGETFIPALRIVAKAAGLKSIFHPPIIYNESMLLWGEESSV